MRTLVWFRADLRLHDNPALTEATRSSSKGVIALYVFSPSEWKSFDYAPSRIDLMLRTLVELSCDLERLNIPLLIRTAASADEIPRLILDIATRHECDRLAFTPEYELNESRRDEIVTTLFTKSGREVRAHNHAVLAQPGTIRTGAGEAYKVFTPFKKALIARLADSPELIEATQAPKKQPSTPTPPDPIPTSIAGFEFTPTPPDELQLSSTDAAYHPFPAGERAARSQLDHFVANRVRDYADARDIPSLDATSRLSPHLALGTISPHACIRAAIDASLNRNTSVATLASATASKSGPSTWISEVIWREFYIHVMSLFPRVCMHRAFDLTTEAIEWDDNPAFLEAWKQGRTGVPIVDAGMRQLRATNWMHNRVRMVTAMFLAKNLFLDWRLGEKHFMNHLVDGFLASNNGGWQWSASTGTDAAPYFRIFNPVSQSRRFDTEGDYIRRWIPELRGVTSDAIHEPWSGKTKSASSGGLFDSREYPTRPIVDLSTTRTRAIEAFRTR
ncbi:MAG: deoxyribodipyrimidine photo-lyase [Phycisphaerales bacterium]|nr:MAG: deoxyribodipyrimidine photo-lyase [Phycisphaerales bacterium]